jgi:hypothetical protein
MGWLGWPYSLLPIHVMSTYVKNLTRDIKLESSTDVNSSLIDIITLHTIYNQTTLDKVMPNDTVKVAIIREPFAHFQSTFDYIDFDFVAQFSIKGPNPMKTYLESPILKEKTIYGRYFQNFIITEFGFPNRSENNRTVVTEFISYIETNFRHVAIMEYFIESLVLLKRMLCWTTEDIVFLHLNKNGNKTHQILPESGQNFTYLKTLHRQWSTADYIFYDYFKQAFWRKIEREGKGFYDEIRDFESILPKVKMFCKYRAESLEEELLIPESVWHGAFNVTQTQCVQMQMNIYRNVEEYFANA